MHAWRWLVGMCCLPFAFAADAVLLIDAEFGRSESTSAQAIRLGAELAADDVNRAGILPAGMRLRIDTADNRGLPARAVDQLRAAASRAEVVAVMHGKFSPAALACVPVAHQVGMPLLLPWSAADGAIDHGLVPSWTFRLSLRDAWAMELLARHALAIAPTRIDLLLPNNSWGRSCQAAIERQYAGTASAQVRSEWYAMGSEPLAQAYERLRLAGAAAVIIAANEDDGATLIKTLAEKAAGDRLPLLFHWGITGGDFPAMTGPALTRVDLRVVQTFSLASSTRPLAARLRDGIRASGYAGDPTRYPSICGAAHAYDLVRLLGMGLAAAGTTARPALRTALCRLDPFQGVVSDYAPAFTEDRREALRPDLLFLARFAGDGRLLPDAGGSAP